ncbi:hypothetical protein ACFST9_17765 [Hymenobacter monticola]|uniref:Lipoprotein n=1 Tax=Hymenobacter monticola TaxID=1705399 RepID=A0ABY4B2H7_9BACT|nr:hypothetical protein [Hymenobacter monticola]UOE32246.1 hypothetical protein MTP16_14015 [Hymenobacter monticola]
MKLLLISCAGLLATACHSQSPLQSAAAERLPNAPAAKVAAASGKAEALPGPVAVAALSPQLREELQSSNLASLLQTVHKTEAFAQDGFFGPDHYHIEFAFTEVRRDPARPTVYYLRGKDRYKGIITPFAGTFTVEQFGEQPYFSAREIAAMAKQGGVIANFPGYYSAIGTFELREDSTRRGAGTFRGRLAVDWYKEKDGSLTLNCRGVTGPSQGGLIKYEGTWTNATTRRTYPVVWAQDIFAYNAVQNVLKEFNIGEREVEINPEYAKLGWSNYWENKEWWTDAQRPVLVSRLLLPPDMAAASTAAADSSLP